MFQFLRGLIVVASLAASAQAQSKPTFEVASIKPSAIDMNKLREQAMRGEMPRMGPHVEGARAEYIFMGLRDLIVLAYKVKPYQVTGPSWMNGQRFDIIATLPEGAKKEDVPLMLQALLEERFKLALHRETKEGPMLALVVAKGGSKMKESAEAPKPMDLTAPLAPGERQIDGPDGPVRMIMNPKTGSAQLNMGERGTATYGMDPATRSMKMEAKQVTMNGFADMLTAFSQAAGVSQPVRDMTGLKGHYEVSISFAPEDLLNMARAQGMAVPNRPAGGAAPNVPDYTASDPGGSSSLAQAVQSMGLKLESRKGMVEHLIIDHLEKMPTEN